ncbi:hypothetical protein PVAND_016672 [Polypedilum vanderplanki]|uniref:Uncharacterized protein n=1 Tax=Polypedilum vanderplanki TaxID=319348 RepID=A0A9J6BFT0_POLVA|nr:hypothetical protein PVAND_016672 [Polypedilum vanderplanki]
MKIFILILIVSLFYHEGDARHITVMEGNDRFFVARKEYNGDLVIGKFNYETNTIYLPYHGKEIAIQTSDVELLDPISDLKWVSFPGGIPENAFEFGREKNLRVFVGKVLHEGKNIIGKVIPGLNKLFIPYYGQELSFNNFEILVYQ